MKKNEAIDYVRSRMGYVPYIGIFDIYTDRDDIPKELIELQTAPIRAKGDFLIVGSHLHSMLTKLLTT